MIIYRCRNCGYVLHVFSKTRVDYLGPPPPSTVIYWYGGICPRCGSELKPPKPEDIKISISKRIQYPYIKERPSCRERILAILNANPDKWFSVKELIYMTGCKKKTVYMVLNDLAKKGIIKRNQKTCIYQVKIASKKSRVEIIHKIKE